MMADEPKWVTAEEIRLFDSEPMVLGDEARRDMEIMRVEAPGQQVQVSNDGETWVNWPSDLCGPLLVYKYMRLRPLS